TSGAITGLSPTEGSSFAWMDTTGDVPPIFDTVDGTFGSRLSSDVFPVTAGTTLTLDAAFLTTDGGPFYDYGIIALVQVPERTSLIVVAAPAISLGGGALRGPRGSRRTLPTD